MARQYTLSEQDDVRRGKIQRIMAHCIELQDNDACNMKCDKCTYNTRDLCSSEVEYKTLLAFELLHYNKAQAYESAWQDKGNRAVIIAAICGLLTVFLCRNCWGNFWNQDFRIEMEETTGGGKYYDYHDLRDVIVFVPRKPGPEHRGSKAQEPVQPEAPKAKANDGAYVSVSNWYQTTKEDLNNDNLHDCIDASMMFVRKNPGAELIINRNEATGMNHMFVKYKGEYIEPQQSREMKEFWGSKYDEALNKAPTDIELEVWGVK